MNVLDVVLLLIVALSATAGLIKGLIREVFALVGVLAGIVVALVFSPQFTPTLGRWFPYESAAYAAALFLLFVATLLAAAFVGKILTKIVAIAHLSFANRLLGAAFGVLRGGLISLVIVLGLTLIVEPDQPVLAHSRVVPYLAWGARAMAPLLPERPRQVLLERLDELGSPELPVPPPEVI